MALFSLTDYLIFGIMNISRKEEILRSMGSEIVKMNNCVHFHVYGLLHGVCVYIWLMNLLPLTETNTYYSVYILCALGSLACLWDLFRESFSVPRKKLLWIVLFAFLFSAAVVLANYEIFLVQRQIVLLVLTLLGGFGTAFPILLWMYVKMPNAQNQPRREHPVRFFLLSFLAIASVYLLYLFFARYPGYLTKDSLSTVGQTLGTVPYNNIMPFWHTVSVGVWIRLGLFLFSDINAGIALTHCMQILLMAACFSYTLVTLYQNRTPGLVLAGVFFLYTAMPYNICYSVTLWKDVPFSVCVLLFVTSLYRLLNGKSAGKSWEYIPLVVGILGFALLRTNGWYAFAATVLTLALVFRRRYKKLLGILLSILVFSWVLINPFLDALGVQKTDFVEALAVPFQQLARVVADGYSLSEEEKATLDEVFYVDQIPDLYEPWLADPIKFSAFRSENRQAIEENMGKYVSLYLRLGMRYPGAYLKAWIDQTKGYWNAGYRYSIYPGGVRENDFGITEMYGDNLISRGFDWWFACFDDNVVFQPLVGIGLQAWGLIACTLINVLKKRREALLGVPVLVLLIGLWLGTPVYSDFRYAYPFFLTLPFLLTVTAFSPEPAPVTEPAEKQELVIAALQSNMEK